MCLLSSVNIKVFWCDVWCVCVDLQWMCLFNNTQCLAFSIYDSRT